ncbi:MAG TPA: hypothetical protein VFB32_00180 [Rudaea sp.]|nr:hypothetical protein [Rudaea sp.]
MRCARRICALGWLAALAAPLLHAEGGPPMLTDDPGTPGDGRWEINLAALSENAAGTETYELPLVDLNYGVGDRLQLKIETPWVITRGAAGDRSGVGNGLAGVKWRFYDGGDDGWRVSTYPQVEFNPGGARSSRHGLADPGTSWLLPIEVEHKFGEIDLDVEAGRWRRSAGRPDTWIGGVVVGHEVAKGFELMFELHDESAVHGSASELVANLGARYDVSERFTVLASAGRDLHDTLGARAALVTYAGLQLHL